MFGIYIWQVLGWVLSLLGNLCCLRPKCCLPFHWYSLSVQPNLICTTRKQFCMPAFVCKSWIALKMGTVERCELIIFYFQDQPLLGFVFCNKSNWEKNQIQSPRLSYKWNAVYRYRLKTLGIAFNLWSSVKFPVLRNFALLAMFTFHFGLFSTALFAAEFFFFISDYIEILSNICDDCLHSLILHISRFLAVN